MKSGTRWLYENVAVGILVAICFPSAHALCVYKGKMYAKTTIQQEFADSVWVVRARLVAADNHWSDEGDSWSMYHLQVVTAFKGGPPSRIAMFTLRDSCGFYLEKGEAADVGGEYLLFLNPIDPKATVPAAARGSVEVNYSCGQSESWNSLSSAKRQRLLDLSHEK
jgi:hypothetical protein